jgi:F-type H+-transporting ATPase subunit b
MHINEAGWVAIGFVVFCILAWRFGAKPFVELLEKRGQEVKDKLDEAESLRIEAKEILQKYKKLHEQAEIDAKNIVKRANDNAKLLQKDAEEAAKKSLKRQENQTKEKIIAAEKKATLEIKNLTVDLALKASEILLKDEMNNKLATKLIIDSTKKINLNL